jgi:serine phosphatase RsbU (regulator of sigma subunit)
LCYFNSKAFYTFGLMRALSTTFVILSIVLTSFAQTTQDSLRELISKAPNDSLKIIAYTELCNDMVNEPKMVLAELMKMNEYCQTIKDIRSKALCLRKIGAIYSYIAYYDRALEFTYQAADLFEKAKDIYGLAYCYNNIGNYYNYKGEFTKDDRFQERSIEYHLKSINLRDTLKDSVPLMNSYNNIGNAYMELRQYEKALKYFNKGYAMFMVKGTEENLEMINGNLGRCYLNIAATAENKMAYYKQAQFYYMNVLKNYKPGDRSGTYASTFIQVGHIYNLIGQGSVGMSYLQKGLEMAQSVHNRTAVMDGAFRLSQAYERSGDSKKALEMMHLYVSNKDSLINEANSSNMEEMQVLYKTSQKDREIDQLSSEKKLKDAEISRSRTIIFSSIGVAALILVLVFVLLRGNIAKRRANLELAKAYRKIETKNMQITDSINYSRRIQTAILPPADLLTKSLKNFFIYYAPKDIVSGDFYWFSEINNKLYFIVVDCTGHGVPGALMSMIGNTLLTEIINQLEVTEPGEILNQLNKGVKHSLRQSGADVVSQDDGMDVSICCIDKNDPSVMKYACANHSIFVKANGKVTELSGDIYSIGGDFGKTEKSFANKTHKLEPDSFIVMSTDGYYDQFGGPKDSKFLISRFEELILKTDLEQNNTSESFAKALENWRGQRRQTDDILVAGFKI